MTEQSPTMEFLMTYGWAILVVLVVIGALAYFGVLKPDKMLIDCSCPENMSVEDVATICNLVECSNITGCTASPTGIIILKNYYLYNCTKGIM